MFSLFVYMPWAIVSLRAFYSTFVDYKPYFLVVLWLIDTTLFELLDNERILA